MNSDIIYDKLTQLNLVDRVHLHGFVSEPVLDDALRQAHLVLNLRHPSMGEASGSQLRIWNAGAPSVVTREGWYAGLPEDVVYSVDTDNEIAQLQALFLKLAADRRAGDESITPLPPMRKKLSPGLKKPQIKPGEIWPCA